MARKAMFYLLLFIVVIGASMHSEPVIADKILQGAIMLVTGCVAVYYFLSFQSLNEQ